MGVSLKIEERRSHSAVSSFRPWVRRAEGYEGTRYLVPCRQVPVKPRRPPSLSLIGEVFPDHSSFSVLRETPMAFSCDYFKKLNGCLQGSSMGNIVGSCRKKQHETGKKRRLLCCRWKRERESGSFADLAFERDACAVLVKD
jgi:hypothetical protein